MNGRDLDAVLASIDGALDDWTVSGDAMRWRPHPPRGLVPDLVIVDDPIRWSAAPGLFASAISAAEQHEAAERALRDLFADVGQALAGLVEAAEAAAGRMGTTFADLAERIRAAHLAAQADRLIPLPAVERGQDPAAYALQARRSRGTGPDRQVQRQHRPRRHR